MFGDSLYSPKPGSGQSVQRPGSGDSIFDRIRRMETESHPDDFSAESDLRPTLPISAGSQFQFFGSSLGARYQAPKAPTSPAEVVASLNDDPYLIQPLVSDESFSLDDVYRYFTNLSSGTFAPAFTEIVDQLRRLAIIDALPATLGQLQDVEQGITAIESALATAYGQRTIAVWFNVPTAQVLFNPSRKVLICPGKGIIGRAAQALKRRVVSNPKESDWYDAETDAEMFENATVVVCSPIADPLNHQLIAVLTITAKNAWTQFDTLLTDHAETKLPFILSTLNTSASRIRTTLAILSSATGNELKQSALMSTSCQSLKSALNCEMAQIYTVDFRNNALISYGGGLSKKAKISLDKGGIAAYVANHGTLVNAPIAAEHPGFSKDVDDDFRSRPIIAIPLVNEASTTQEIFGVVVCRGKRGKLCFDEHDTVLLESLSAVISRTLTNFKHYRSDVLNLKRVLTAQDHYIELLRTAEQLSSIIDKDQLFEMIMTRSRRIVAADRCSLFTTDRKREYLLSKVASGTQRPIVIPISQGIAGYVATSGKLLNILDAYDDPRFNKDVDLVTGYRTKSILCLPIFGRNDSVIGITQMINKLSGVFDQSDVDLMKAFNVFCGIALGNANLFEETNSMKVRVEGLLNLAMSMSKIQSLPLILENICECTISLINCERCSVIINKNFEDNLMHEAVSSKQLINIHDVSKDSRYDPTTDRISGVETKSLLIVPILSENETPIGIIKVINKVPGYDGLVFNEDDESLTKAMASFSGRALSSMLPKTPVTFETFADVPEQISLIQQQMILSSDEEILMSSFKSQMDSFDKHTLLRFTIHCFISLELMSTLKIPFPKFYQLLMLIQATAPDLPYHNLVHAMETLQFTYALLKATDEYKNFEPIETFALLLAALMHDCGHKGELFEIETRDEASLKIVFKNQPPRQTAHARAAIDLLSNRKDSIIDKLEPSLKSKFWNVFIQLILSSACYKQEDFVQLWRSGDHSRLNTMRLILKIANMGNIVHPYEVAMERARFLREEFEATAKNQKFIPGSPEDQKIQSILSASVEASQLNFAQTSVLPLIEIAVLKWKQIEPLKTQLLENVRLWKDLVQ